MRRRKPFWKRSARMGLTLVECLVGMVILGTVLSSVLIARGRYVHQAALARRQAAAVLATDRLLANWWSSGTPPVLEAEGLVPGPDRFRWRTRLVENPSVSDLKARVLRLEILDAQQSAIGSQVLMRIDMVVPGLPSMTSPAAASAAESSGGDHGK